jgi:hypothetical protein
MDTRTTRAPGHLRRDRIDIPTTFKAEGFIWKGCGPWVDLGICPFHGDEHPSLRGNLETGRVRCMSCGWSGDLVAFIMQRHGLGFRQAAQHLGAWEELSGEPDYRPFRRVGEAFRKGGIR